MEPHFFIRVYRPLLSIRFVSEAFRSEEVFCLTRTPFLRPTLLSFNPRLGGSNKKDVVKH